MNLLTETREILEKHGKTPADVLWCGSETFGWFSWDEFAKLADTEYYTDDDYVAWDLVIVGNNFWLEIGDGLTFWEYRTLPIKPEKKREPVALTLEQSDREDIRLVGGSWSMSELNGVEEL